MKIMTALTLLVLATLTAPAQEPWQQLGPAGADVAGLATVPGFPDELYLVTAGHPAQVWHTQNLGLTWTMLDTIHDLVKDLVVRPDDVDFLYATGARGLVYRSADGGRTWMVYGNLAGEPAGRRLAFKPGQPLLMWAAAEIPGLGDMRGLGIYSSTDGGSSWDGTTVDSGYDVRAELLVADAYRANRVFIGGGIDNQARLFRSDDGGGSWTAATTGLTGTCAWDVAASPLDANILVCATDAGIFRSTNSGSSWQLRMAVPAWSVEFAPASPHPAYAGSDNLVFRSDDNGLTWTTDTTEFAGTRTTRLFVNPVEPLEVYAGNGSGVFHSTNGGFDWTALTDEFQSLTLPWLWFFPQAPDTVYTCPAGYGLLRSDDRGRTWSRFPGFAGDGFVTGIAVHPRDQDTAFCVTSIDSRLWRTTDRGDSWQPYPLVDRFVARGIGFHPVEPDTMYAWGGQRDSDAGRPLFRVFRSSDRGMTWTRILARGFDQGICQGLAIPNGPDTIFAWGEADGFRALYRTTDRGGTWTSVASGVSGSAIRDFAVSPVSPGTWFAATAAGVYRTTDHGETWDDLGLSNVSAVLPDTASIDGVVVGTDTAGIYWTTDAGLFWDRDTVALASRNILRLYRHPEVAGAVYCCAAGASILARGVVGIHEGTAGTMPAARVVRPTLVRDVALVPGRYDPGTVTVLRLFRPDGRLATGQVPFRRTDAGLSWSRPPGLTPGVYLLKVDSGRRHETYRVVLAP